VNSEDRARELHREAQRCLLELERYALTRRVCSGFLIAARVHALRVALDHVLTAPRGRSVKELPDPFDDAGQHRWCDCELERAEEARDFLQALGALAQALNYLNAPAVHRAIVAVLEAFGQLEAAIEEAVN